MAGRVRPLSPNTFRVQGSKPEAYTVDADAGSCTCPDHTRGRAPLLSDTPTCKHLLTVLAWLALNLRAASRQARRSPSLSHVYREPRRPRHLRILRGGRAS